MSISPSLLPESSAQKRILHAAYRLIGAEGLAALTNRRIAAAASVSLGSLTYHFPSQEVLLRECLALHVREEVQRIEVAAQELRERRLGAPELGMEIQRMAGLSASRPELLAELEIHLRAARDPVLQETSRLCFGAYEAFAAAALEALGVPEPKRHAPHVVGLMLGTGIKQLGTGEHDAAGLADHLLTIAQGASARGASSGPAGADEDTKRKASPGE